MKNDKRPLYLIDSYGLIYRSYFAFMSRPLRNAQGQNISALFGFARTLVSLIDDGAPAADDNGNLSLKPERPYCLAAIFDSRTPTFRHKEYAEYKANRAKAPDDLHAQVPLVEEMLQALGVPSFHFDGFEADDIIATLAKRCQQEGRQCYILSSDKDLLQLVGEGTYQLRPMKSSKNDESSSTGKTVPQRGLPYELVGPDEVKAEWGVAPEKVLDLLSMIGDASDNVPGVKGIGEKTAVKLMARYGSLDSIYENIAGIEGAVGKKLAEGKENAYFAKKLITLECEVPLSIKNLDDLSIEKIDRSAGASMLLREGIRQTAFTLDPKAKAAEGESSPRQNSPQTIVSAKNKVFDTTPPDSSLLGDGKYKLILTVPEAETIFERAKHQKLLALDFETNSLDAWNAKPVGISLSLKPREAYYIPIAAHGGREEFVAPETIKALLEPLLMQSDMCIVAHNAKYDYKVTRGWGIARWECTIWDTMVAAWIDDPERNSYALDSLAGSIFNFDATPYNSIVPKGSTFDAVDLKTAGNYSCEDADLTMRLKYYFEPRLIRSESLNLFTNMEMPLLPILAEMEGAGIKIESQVLRDYGVELGENLKNIERSVWDLVGHEFNLASPKQLQEVLFVERKLKPGKKTKTGYSTDVSVLEELAREDPVPALILRNRTLAKLKSTYVDTLAEMNGPDGRLHTHFVQTGTATGRLSSRDPNLQNIPIRDEEGRRIRRAFIAEKGHVLVSADYSQIELVVLAHLSQDANLIKAFNEGKDVHRMTASLIFKVDENDVDSSQRRIAKTINFGVMYGMSAFRLSNELGISRHDAQSFIDAYFATYSGIRAFIESVVHKTEEQGFVSTISGRRRYIQAINSSNKVEKAGAERVAVNTPIQGSAADIVKTAMLRLDAVLAQSKLSARMLLQVHDELIFECPKAEAEKLSSIVKTEMENAIKLSVPLRVNVEIGQRWGDFH
jgi:DNA polymerase-1